MRFLRCLSAVISFMQSPRSQRRLVFYSEGRNNWPHLEGLILSCLGQSRVYVTYLSSDPFDPGLQYASERFRAFEIGDGAIRTWLFANIDTDVMVMTIPDLENYQLKRSRHPVHYVYVQHSLVSLHMIYRTGAFDHYDTIFCSGPHHVQEVRALEQLADSTAKQVVEHGYARLSAIINEAQHYSPPPRQDDQPLHVLVAPSWGPQGTIESHGDELVDVLLQAGFEVTLRPHPQTAKLAGGVLEQIRHRHGGNSLFHFEDNVAGQGSLFHSHVMISDWSGAALEYALGLGKPVVFIDVPRKVNNPDYTALDLEPIEVSIREQIGAIVHFSKLESLPNVLHESIAAATDSSNYTRLRNQLVFNIGTQDEVGAQFLTALIN